MKSRKRLLIAGAVGLIAAWTGCAKGPSASADHKLEESRLCSKVWYGPYLRCPSFESDRVLRLSQDGTGTLSSRSFGYVKPGIAMGSSVGSGAFTQVVTWAVSWRPDGENRIKLSCSGSHTSTGTDYFAGAPPQLSCARLSGSDLWVYYHNNIRFIFTPIDSRDARINPSQQEIKHRVAVWAAAGPQTLAGSGAVVMSQSYSGSTGYVSVYPTHPVVVQRITVVQPTVHYYGSSVGVSQAALMNNLSRH